jgi:hypothetical protein
VSNNDSNNKASNERVRATGTVRKSSNTPAGKQAEKAPRRDLILPFNKLRPGTTYEHVEEQAKFTKVCDAFSVDESGKTAIHDPLDPCRVIRSSGPVHPNYHNEKKWYNDLGRTKPVS